MTRTVLHLNNSKIVWLLLLLMATTLTGCGWHKTSPADQTAAKSGQENLSGELNLFIWSEYMPQSVIDEFEKKYGVKVNYSTYSSNEEMLAKLMAGAAQYDISVATDYMVEIMRKKDMIEPIDQKNIPNLKFIGPEFKNMSFDPGNRYTAPYMWGDMVIVVNTQKFPQSVTGYADLWSPKFKNSMVVLDDMRGIIGMTLKKLGYSINETDPAKLAQAQAELQKFVPNIKAYDSDSPKTLLINGEANAGLVWGAEAYLACKENPHLKVFLPKEGMYLWQDNFVIPKDAPHKRNAEAFINFILDPKISAEISKSFPYANPNAEAHKYIDHDILNNIAVYPPPSDLAKGEHLKDVGNATANYDRIWSEIKQQ